MFSYNKNQKRGQIFVTIPNRIKYNFEFLNDITELIEKVINALDNIKIEEKTDISFSDNGKTYILELADGTTQVYNFQGSYYCKDKINYKISNYKELNKIEIPKEV